MYESRKEGRKARKPKHKIKSDLWQTTTSHHPEQPLDYNTSTLVSIPTRQ
jgi:hypothetical protein